ncbi:MAG TPA: SpoIID/LytB domain-containing protein [Solirubrobacteraceae bacterium]|jgi:SpoIID/LytB domain protein|nr:SpoIID/LytB domain-containing protein [Solirubrobacteraceae bacterium]
MRPSYQRPVRRISSTLRACALAGAFALAGVLAGAFALAGVLAPAASASQTLVIAGAGYGHGVGMSQEGALGYAQHGYGYAAILAHYYTGTALGSVPAGTTVRVLLDGKVRKLPLEAYVRGVVGAEMPASWPLAVLEAQAVASRTYALTDHAGGSRFDVYADTRSQVYLGTKAQTTQTDAAVAATAGQVVTYAGQPAITYFFASSGGMTEDVQDGFPGAAPEPWLRGVPDPFDQGPQHTWSVSMSFAAAAARLRGLFRGAFRGIEVLSRGYSPRILAADVLGSKGNTQVSGPELEDRLGLYDDWAYFSVRTAQGVTPEPDLSHYRTAPPTPEPTGGTNPE